MNLGDLMKVTYPNMNDQIVEDMNKVGDYIVDQIDYVYVNKVIDPSTSFSKLIDEITDPESPAKNSDYLMYHILDSYYTSFMVQQGLSSTYINIFPNVKPYPYIFGPISAAMQISVELQLPIIFGIGTTSTIFLETFIKIFDTFTVTAYATT